jgi:hypothetical protein
MLRLRDDDEMNVVMDSARWWFVLVDGWSVCLAAPKKYSFDSAYVVGCWMIDFWHIKKIMPFKTKDDGSTPKAKIVRLCKELGTLNRPVRKRGRHTTHNNQSEETGKKKNNNLHDESSDNLFELDSSASSSSSNGEEDTDDENDIDKDLTSNHNVIVNVDLLKSLVSRDLVCGVCHHRVEMVVSTIGIATNLRLKCSYCTKLQQPCCSRPAESLLGQHGNSYAAYDANQMFVLGLQTNGLGYDGSDSLCGFLGLKKPWGKQ